MSPSDGTRQISFRAGELEEALRQRSQVGESISLTARRDLERYYDVLWRELATVALSLAEAALVVDALRGTIHDLGSGPTMLWAGVEDAIRLEGLDAKWGIEQPAVLVAKLRSLSPARAWAVIDAAERWWAQDWPGMTTGESLRAVGLTREEGEIESAQD